MEIKKVKQNSELGGLGLSALFNKGFAGPNYSLDDLDLTIIKVGESIEVSFYDMSCFINPQDKNYSEFKKYFY